MFDAPDPSEVPTAAVQGLFKELPFTGAADATYLCDAGCRPNPGTHLPVVWDGATLLAITPRQGTNHQAAYQAVIEALQDAVNLGFAKVEIRLTSDLVFRQLTTGGYCRNRELEQLRGLCDAIVPMAMSVRLVRTTEPFNLAGLDFSTRGKLRDHALASLWPGSARQRSHRSTLAVRAPAPPPAPPRP